MDIQAYLRAVLNQDAVSMRSFLHENAAVRWHCTNERFTAEEFIRANCEYPGEWDGEIERIEEWGDLTVAALRAFTKDKSASFHCVSFIRMQDDKIIELDEYWADDGPPPAWRAEKSIGKRIIE